MADIVHSTECTLTMCEVGFLLSFLYSQGFLLKPFFLSAKLNFGFIVN